ncbi:patatin-like phospholipase family protein [Bradyrhizobium sp. LjRoot220]|uniref:patatin-like phospholipase family protein n=1 Tax=Bradyrhizobium sp. LjRoot220 TaxID=3342284 RepID=UPI003ED011C0
MPSIQVAFQGGGARFVEMLPIAHALAKAHDDGIINITRVAGSSAGSICAALIACHADFDVTRDFIRREGAGRAKSMRRWCSSFGAESPNANRLRAMVAIWMAYRGKALLHPKVLVTFLNELFIKAAPASSRQIETINAAGGIQLLVTGSDLSLSRGVIFESGNLIERIMHSAAIPFAFRTFLDVVTSPYVDGGLCENLPVEQLLAQEDFDGPVFCVSIGDEEPQPYVPTGAKDYCLQLISASMNHNVDRSRRLVGLSNQIEEKSGIDTFAFEAAIGKLDDEDWYAAAFDRTMDKIHKIAQLYEMVGVAAPSKLSGRLSASKMMHSLFKVFETALGTSEWEYIKSGFVVRAECLHRLRPSQIRSADYVVRIATIRARGDNLVCFNSSAHLNDQSSIIPTAWTCFNETQSRDLRVQAIPVKNPADPSGGSIGVLIFFENPLSSVAKGDILTIKSHFLLENAMGGLNTNGGDYISVSNPHSIPVATVETVLVYPASFGTISATADGIFAPISAAEVQAQYLVNLPNYHAVGVSAQRLAPGSVFRANFFRNVG